MTRFIPQINKIDDRQGHNPKKEGDQGERSLARGWEARRLASSVEDAEGPKAK
jgi:hypothetical protein